MIAALALLGLNDLRVDAEAGALVDPATGVSTGKVAKAEVAIFLQEHSRSRRA